MNKLLCRNAHACVHAHTHTCSLWKCIRPASKGLAGSVKQNSHCWQVSQRGGRGPGPSSGSNEPQVSLGRPLEAVPSQGWSCRPQSSDPKPRAQVHVRQAPIAASNQNLSRLPSPSTVSPPARQAGLRPQPLSLALPPASAMLSHGQAPELVITVTRSISNSELCPSEPLNPGRGAFYKLMSIRSEMPRLLQLPADGPATYLHTNTAERSLWLNQASSQVSVALF